MAVTNTNLQVRTTKSTLSHKTVIMVLALTFNAQVNANTMITVVTQSRERQLRRFGGA